MLEVHGENTNTTSAERDTGGDGILLFFFLSLFLRGNKWKYNVRMGLDADLGSAALFHARYALQ